jgi:hypothetical protein
MVGKVHELRDMKADETVGIQVDGRNRVWVCIDGQCVLRVVGAKHVEMTDLRMSAAPEAETE